MTLEEQSPVKESWLKRTLSKRKRILIGLAFLAAIIVFIELIEVDLYPLRLDKSNHSEPKSQRASWQGHPQQKHLGDKQADQKQSSLIKLTQDNSSQNQLNPKIFSRKPFDKKITKKTKSEKLKREQSVKDYSRHETTAPRPPEQGEAVARLKYPTLKPGLYKSDPAQQGFQPKPERVMRTQDQLTGPHLDSAGQKPEVRQIVFAKVHKAASSTLQNILLRFAIARNLSVLLPARKKSSTTLSDRGSRLIPKEIIEHPEGQPFDILCNHIIYNQTEISRYFRDSAVRVAILREPLKQTLSALAYFTQYYPPASMAKGFQKHPDDPINGFLNNPSDFCDPNDSAGPAGSYINNRMSVDLGIDRHDFESTKKNMSKIQAFIKQVEKQFNIILIADYFDESMILLRRYLGWSMKDIIYIKVNTANLNRNPVWRREPIVTAKILESFHRWQRIDYELYQHFLHQFQEKIRNEPHFVDELNAYRKVKSTVKDFCVNDNKHEVLHIPRSTWTARFEVSKRTCTLMTLTEYYMVALAKEKQLNRLELSRKRLSKNN
ncbi:galactose-3-o-sulfotransferase 3 [Plakobranchus ocellatus]|uniref:Galactose-3-o-sulfotransferase 3 n=1 Tax=Plakobranchus ocellatus TaxID=259542 RepID=A0AAV4DEM6_9GAST|nr:galactose-3-o-sulfotransferase 3 [Plakobranchus ocellatus]